MRRPDVVDPKHRKTHGEYAQAFDGTDSIYEQIIDGKPDSDPAPPSITVYWKTLTVGRTV